MDERNSVLQVLSADHVNLEVRVVLSVVVQKEVETVDGLQLQIYQLKRTILNKNVNGVRLTSSVE